VLWRSSLTKHTDFVQNKHAVSCSMRAVCAGIAKAPTSDGTGTAAAKHRSAVATWLELLKPNCMVAIYQLRSNTTACGLSTLQAGREHTQRAAEL
jgi:hypothetical protein